MTQQPTPESQPDRSTDRLPVSARREDLSDSQRSRLAERLRSGLLRRTIERTDRSQSLPLSFMQEQLFVHQSLFPQSIAYHRPCLIHLRGPLDVTFLEHALTELVRRHESLRTVIFQDGMQPEQKIVSPWNVSLRPIDFDVSSDLPEVWEQQLSEEARRPFDLQNEVLWRCQLLRCNEQKHVLQFTFHHLIFDHGAESVLLRELSESYHAYANGSNSNRAELPIQYADYSAWQRNQAESERYQQGLQHWEETLRVLPLPNLSTDRDPSRQFDEAGGLVAVEFSGELVESLRRLSYTEDVTLFMIVLAAWTAILSRASDQTDFVVGCPVAGRVRPEFEDLIGVFINTLPMRLRWTGEISFRELLRQAREVTLESLRHQDVSLLHIVRQVVAPQGHGGWPGFDVQLVYERESEPRTTTTGLIFEASDLFLDATTADLSLELIEGKSSLSGRLIYRRSHWNHSSVDRFVQQLITLLQRVSSEPESLIGQIPILSEFERRRLVIDWNSTEHPLDDNLNLAQLVERQAATLPDAIALRFGAKTLTFRELNHHANQLARFLRTSGVQPDQVVAVCVHRSPELIVALLAVLKSGAAYLPLDPADPPDRLLHLVTDAGAVFLVTEVQLLDRLPDSMRRVICLDRDSIDWSEESVEDLEPLAKPEHLAYVIHTSGSTGKPKGVEITHRAVVNFLQAMQRSPGLAPGEGVLAITTVTFDISVLEIFLPLIGGGRIELVPRDVVIDGQRLREVIERSSVKIIQATPTTWKILLEAGWTGNHTLKLITGGESLTSDLARNLFSRCGELWNLYGPTEATVWATSQHITDPNQPITVGKPIANLKAFILDRHRELQPIGVPGELFLGGVGIARGYRGRPDLTVERFHPDPFTNDTEARLYQTGDLARLLDDGSIEHLGRLDQQVKLRGHRIEPEEIEAVLCEHPEISSAVVQLWDNPVAEPQLVAYIVLNGGKTTNRDIYDFAARHLPAYMVPASIMTLDRLPITTSGKIDRRALPPPDSQSRSSTENKRSPPQSPLEIILAETWSEVLGKTHIGRDENFFEIGGHSLLALRIAARCRLRFTADVPVALIFQYPTIASLAEALEPTTLRVSLPASEPEPAQTREPVPNLSYAPPTPLHFDTQFRINSENRLPLALSQQRVFFLHQLDGQEAVYNIAQIWQFDGPLDTEAVRSSLEALVSRHEPLRTIFELQDGVPFQSVMPPSPFHLPQFDLRQLSQREQSAAVEQHAVAEAETPFRLETDLLLRAQLLRIADDQYLLLLTFHHLAADGFSLWVFWRELRQIYEAIIAGNSPSLRELSCRYADFVAWQLSENFTGRFERELIYWRKQLSGLLPLELPYDRPRANWSKNQGARISFLLNRELSNRLRRFCRQEETTLHITLLAAFQTLLYRYSQQDDFAVGVPILGRGHPDFEQMIGMFVNTLAIRVVFSPKVSFRELLHQVREKSLMAYDHQQVPFEKLLEELNPERHGGRSPLVQVLFQLLDVPEPENWTNITISRRPSMTKHCHVDLELVIRPQGSELAADLVFSTELFDEESIHRLIEHFQILLGGLLSNPDQPVEQLPLMSDLERHRILVEWNETRREIPELCVHQLFEQQAERVPHDVALVAGKHRWTYADLNRRANRLVHQLQKFGVKTETRVGISTERCPEMIVGVLAILKAGGAYVPLDPSTPQDRLAYLVSDSGMAFLLNPPGRTESFQDLSVPVLTLEDASLPCEFASEIAPAVEVTPDNLIYVIYTSGTTGTPKGVEVLHRGVVRLVCQADYVCLENAPSILQMATLSFDASTFEIWAPLLNGGCCVLAPPYLLEPVELQRLVEEERIRTMWLTSTLFNTLIDESPDALRGLSQLLVGGEALSVPHVRRAQELLSPQTQIINGYGPTECTTFACCYPLPGMVPAGCISIPIGRPIANTTAYVLDSLLQPTPIGIAGELYLGGAGLARGYLNRPELTVERFVSNPFSDDPHSRLYRTGDRVRWRSDGTLEFLGRFDEQVKIRGYRIEPGEIESTLRQHPAVADAVVQARTDPGVGGYQLVAYLVL